MVAVATRDEVRVLDVGRARPDIRDKKLRVRVDGDRIVPYYTRGQIEQGVLDAAQVIVWVDSAAALYSMQVQGSGKVRLQDGKIVRLAYAEQNGHPFLPPVQGSLRPGQASVPIPQTRGIPLRTWLASDQASGNGGEQIDPAAPTTRGARSKAAAGGNQGTNAARERDSQEMSSEVARVVDLLLKGAGTKVAAKDNSTLSTDSRKTSSGIDKNSTSTTISRKPSSRIDNNAVNTSDAMNLSSLHTLPGLTAFSSDPSYVSRWFSRGRQPSRESRCETGRSAHRRQL